ncbi:MAG: hypothetical protein KDB01_21845, partial [Planctomycetaceae bacterium]|nr:hypothetical protein [Planctomycetaceae bacterium]
MIESPDSMTMSDWERVIRSLKQQVRQYGINVSEAVLPAGVPGRIRGRSIQTNKCVNVEMQCHLVAHCFGHIVQWSVDEQAIRNLYSELRAAKLSGSQRNERLHQVLMKFRLYEEEASEYGASLYQAEPDALRGFSIFARADIESHLTLLAGKDVAPWDSYFAAWLTKVENGEIQIALFRPKVIPAFQPVEVPEIDVIQVVE